MLLDIIIMHKKRKGIILKDLRGLEEILNSNKSIKYKRIESNNKNILRMRIETVSDNNNKAEAEILEKIKKDSKKLDKETTIIIEKISSLNDIDALNSELHLSQSVVDILKKYAPTVYDTFSYF